MQKLLLVLGAVALVAMTHMMMSTSENRPEFLAESMEEPLFNEWVQWKLEHGKVYQSSVEESHRMSVWLKNKAWIQENQGEEYTLGLNLFSDLTNEEWKAMYLMTKGIVKSFHTEETSSETHLQGVQAPSSVDWVTQNVTIPVLNQGQCGSCWAFSTVESIDSAFAMAKAGTPVPDLSEQQVTSCSQSYGEYGCNGGNVVPAYKYVLAHPLTTSKQYPYTSGTTRVTGVCDKTKEATGTYKITGYKTIPANNCDALQTALSTRPISVCVDASNWQNYKSGIFSKCGTSLDHCVLAVGYNTSASEPYWLVQNSWTTGWGQKGFIQLKMGNTCGVCKEAQYPTV